MRDLIACVLLGSVSLCTRAATPPEALRRSLAYVEVTAYPFDEYRPWKRAGLENRAGFGCAVQEDAVLVPAALLADAKAIRLRLSGRNDFLEGRLLSVDWSANLAVVKLVEPEKAQLVPIHFHARFTKGKQVTFNYLSRNDRCETGGGELEKAVVLKSALSPFRFLTYVVINPSDLFESGELCMLGDDAIGIAAGGGAHSVEVVSAEVVNHFLADALRPPYEGFPKIGFKAEKLLDPAFRAYLKLPEGETGGMYVAEVYTIGTGSDVLKPGDVICAIDGVSVDAHGRFDHPVYGKIVYRHRVTGKKVGEKITFTLWRQGKKLSVASRARTFRAEDMLVPPYEYGRQPEFVITGGFVFQKLTLPYLEAWGEDWKARVAPSLTRYYLQEAFLPRKDRRQIVVLSYVIPTSSSVGYHNLRQRIVTAINGMPISSVRDVLAALQRSPQQEWDVVACEYAYPPIVISRKGRAALRTALSLRYGIRVFEHVEQ